MLRRHSLASFLIIRDQLAELVVAAVGSVKERVRHALGGVHVRTLAAIRLQFITANRCKLGVARTAHEQVLYQAFAGEAEGEFVGDDVDYGPVGADLGGCDFVGGRCGDDK